MKLIMNNKLLIIRKGNIDELNHLKQIAMKERVILKDTISDVNYIIAQLDGLIIGFVGYSILKNKARFKSDFVHPEFRCKGIYSILFQERLKRVKNIKQIDAFCTKFSLPKYLKNGFIIKKINNFGITYVTKKN